MKWLYSVSAHHHSGGYDLDASSTFLEVGFPLKKSWLRELWGGLNLGCRKMQPLAMASRGAGPSYGKPNPMKSLSGNQGKRRSWVRTASCSYPGQHFYKTCKTEIVYLNIRACSKLMKASVRFPPWPFWVAAAAPAAAADHGSWQKQGPLAAAVSRSTPSHGSPCSDAEWSGTSPSPFETFSRTLAKHLKNGQHRVINLSLQARAATFEDSLH